MVFDYCCYLQTLRECGEHSANLAAHALVEGDVGSVVDFDEYLRKWNGSQSDLVDVYFVVEPDEN